jgi:Flp pilus assembly protein TadB
VITLAGGLTGLLLGAAVLLWPRSTRTLGLVRTPRQGWPVEGHREHAPSATADRVADGLLLLSLALRAGFGPIEALEAAAAHTDGAVGQQLRTVAAAHRWGREPMECWALVPSVWQPAAVAWQAAMSAGISPGALLVRSASVIRDREAQRVEAALAKAGVLLVLPLGLAFLPGFVATTIVPVVLRLVGGFLDGGVRP